MISRAACRNHRADVNVVRTAHNISDQIAEKRQKRNRKGKFYRKSKVHRQLVRLLFPSKIQPEILILGFIQAICRRNKR